MRSPTRSAIRSLRDQLLQTLFVFAWMTTMLGLAFVLTVLVTSPKYARADQAEQSEPASTPSEFEREISFEDELVEGVNQRPMDSLTHFGDGSDDGRSHLYLKRTEF